MELMDTAVLPDVGRGCFVPAGEIPGRLAGQWGVRRRGCVAAYSVCARVWTQAMFTSVLLEHGDHYALKRRSYQVHGTLQCSIILV